MKQILTRYQPFRLLIFFATLAFSSLQVQEGFAQCNMSVTITFAPNPICLGDQVTFTANVTGGTAPYTYSWGAWPTGFPVYSTESFWTMVADSIYWFDVDVTDDNGCTATAHYKMTPTFYNIQMSSTETCNPGNPFELEPTSVPPNSTFQWSTGATTPSILGYPGNSYSVTVSGPNGCTHVLNADVPNIEVLEADIDGPAELCPTQTGALSTLTSPNWIYEWSTGETGPTTPIPGPGSYSVTVTNPTTGCTATDIYDVPVTPPLPPVLNYPLFVCPNTAGTIEVMNTGDYTQILWSNGQTGPSIPAFSYDYYTVTVTQPNGCTSETVVSFEDYFVVGPIILGGPDICVGQEELDWYVAPQFADYNWSTGETAPNITITQPGTYELTVTDANGCTSTTMQEVLAAAAPLPVIEPVSGLCNGNSQVINVQGGPFQTYAWSTGATTSSITATQTGTYVVTVTNVRGCSSTASVVVSGGTPPAATVTASPANCTGTVTLTASGGSTYLWSNGATTPAISATTNGNYTVTVTGSGGCTATATGAVNIATPPTATVSVASPNCSNSVSLTASGGASYLWSNGATTATINATSNGNYTVTVTASGGCTATASGTVNIPAPPQVQVSGPAGVCAGTSATLMATAGFASYQWSNGGTSNSIAVNQPGSYLVTVTNTAGCTATSSFSINNFPQPVANIGGPNTFCTGGSAVLSVAGTFSSITWSTGATTPDITVAQPGNYTVTVTNQQGCTNTDAQAVTAGSGLSFDILQSPAGCNGTMTLSAGSGFSTYAWSNGATTPTITVSQAGSYSVTVSDTNAGGCTGSAAANITLPLPPTVSISGPASACTGSTATLTVTGSFDSYLWSNGAATADISVSQPGNYTVTVTDASSGCTALANHQFSALALPTIALNGPAGVCAGTVANLVASGNFAQANWSTGATTNAISVSQPGLYSVTVTNASGCTSTASQDFNLFAPPTLDITGPASICTGGTSTFVASGNFAQVMWSNGESTPSINVTQPGTYEVIATSANGCTVSASQSLSVNNNLLPAIAEVLQPCASSATLDVGGGFTSYLWSNGAATPTINVTQAGSYSVTVTDGSGCTGEDEVALSFPNQPQVSILGSSSICTGGSAVFSISGSFPQVTWSTGETVASIQVAQPGSYAVTVTDANGCTATDSQSLSIGTSLFPDITPANLDCNGSATLDAGAGLYANYLWSNGATTPTITVTQAGTYTVTVSDASGCSGEALENLSFPTPPQVQVLGPSSICAGNNAQFSLSGTFANVVWSTGSTAPSIGVAQPGSYSVTVTDANGCTAVANQQLAVNALPVPDLVAANLGCDGTGTLGTGSVFDSYLWSNGAVTPTIAVTQSGNYTVTVTNSNGCTGTNQLAINLPVPPQITIMGSDQLCEGYEEILYAPGNFVSYSWSTNETTPQITITIGGQYGVTVTDNNGCTSSASWMVAYLPTQYSFVENHSCNIQDTATVIQTLTSFSGCDSVITTTTILDESLTATLNLSACQGAAASFNGVDIPAGSTQDFVFTTAQGCDSILSVIVAELPAVQLTGATTPCCTNGSNGSVTLSTMAGTPPFQFAMNGANYQDVPVFLGLAPGNYSVLAQDANGCSMEMPMQVEAIPPTAILLEDAEFGCGEGTVQLAPQVLAGDPQAVTWRWSTGDETQNLQVNGPGIYTLTAEDACQVQTFEVTVNAAEDWDQGYFYVPNSFSPNGDGLNDLFAASPDPDAEIRKFELKVFDRWGNSMFSADDPNSGWDGLNREMVLQNEVFVWYLKAVVADCLGEDKELFLKGGVNVMR